MKSITVTICFIALSFSLYSISFSNEEEAVPETGFVKNNGSNVRAGDNINFRSLCKLEKGDPVKIIGKRYSWFKIILPKKAHLYIKNDYVDLEQDTGIGAVTADRVSLRAGPGTKYSILGQVSEPETLTVITEVNGWYEIEPPEGTPGWMHSSQVSFSFKDIEDVTKPKEALQAN